MTLPPLGRTEEADSMNPIGLLNASKYHSTQCTNTSRVLVKVRDADKAFSRQEQVLKGRARPSPQELNIFLSSFLYSSPSQGP
jgi:transposase